MLKFKIGTFAAMAAASLSLVGAANATPTSVNDCQDHTGDTISCDPIPRPKDGYVCRVIAIADIDQSPKQYTCLRCPDAVHQDGDRVWRIPVYQGAFIQTYTENTLYECTSENGVGESYQAARACRKQDIQMAGSSMEGGCPPVV